MKISGLFLYLPSVRILYCSIIAFLLHSCLNHMLLSICSGELGVSFPKCGLRQKS